ncbi:MAG: hypothetical protein MK193_02355 [Lentisphaeria bacterium]|nr:hypothetical protein [Lentisphaeria bacterium]
MADHKGPISSGIKSNSNDNIADYGLTATVTLQRKGMGASTQHKEAPTSTQVSHLPHAVATATDVKCPNSNCSSEFEVTPQLYGAVAECPECAMMFVIKPPGSAVGTTPAPAPAPASASSDPMNTIEMTGNNKQFSTPRPSPQRRSSSGINVDNSAAKDYGLTATVTLSRSGMGMMQKEKAAPVQSVQRFSIANGNQVNCPQCQTEFPITPEAYGAIAECSECSCEFEIRAPASQQKVAPTPVAAAAPKPAVNKTPKPTANKGSKSGPKSNARKSVTAKKKTQTNVDIEPTPASVPAPVKNNNALVYGLIGVIVLLIILIVVVVVMNM